VLVHRDVRQRKAHTLGTLLAASGIHVRHGAATRIENAGRDDGGFRRAQMSGRPGVGRRTRKRKRRLSDVVEERCALAQPGSVHSQSLETLTIPLVLVEDTMPYCPRLLQMARACGPLSSVSGHAPGRESYELSKLQEGRSGCIRLVEMIEHFHSMSSASTFVTGNPCVCDVIKRPLQIQNDMGYHVFLLKLGVSHLSYSLFLLINSHSYYQWIQLQMLILR
jgi:hypothetical protein